MSTDSAARRPGGSAASGRLAIPVGVNLATIGVSGAWFLESALRVEAAGYQTAWAWDHFISRGRLTDPVLECWTTLAAAAVTTSRLRVGAFVSNVMNRHPAVLARMAATLADLSRAAAWSLASASAVIPASTRPTASTSRRPPERAARLEEAVAVLRLLLSGGPVDYEGRYFTLRGAHAFPVPQPPLRIIIGGETPAGARLAARIGDVWTCFADKYERLRPIFDEALAAANRQPGEVAVMVGLNLERVRGHDDPIERAPDDAAAVQPVLADLAATAHEWQARGADELVLHWIGPQQLDAVLAAGERARQ